MCESFGFIDYDHVNPDPYKITDNDLRQMVNGDHQHFGRQWLHKAALRRVMSQEQKDTVNAMHEKGRQYLIEYLIKLEDMVRAFRREWLQSERRDLYYADRLPEGAIPSRRLKEVS